MAVDKHGLKINGLKAASGDTQNYYGGFVNQVYYNMKTGGVIVRFRFHTSSYIDYGNADIIFVCKSDHHLTMQEIANAIWRRVTEVKATRLES